MIYEKSEKVFCCCGKYIVPTNAVKDKKIVCPSCKKVLDKPIEFPKIIIVKY